MGQTGCLADSADPSGVRPPVVLYDGGCVLCRREIALYRRLPGAERIDWVDISTRDDLNDSFGIDRDQALARLHVRDAQGRWHTGAYAFAALWSELPGYRWLARGLRATRLIRPLDGAYRHFARWRLRRRCTSARCASNG